MSTEDEKTVLFRKRVLTLSHRIARRIPTCHLRVCIITSSFVQTETTGASIYFQSSDFYGLRWLCVLLSFTLLQDQGRNSTTSSIHLGRVLWIAVPFLLSSPNPNRIVYLSWVTPSKMKTQG